MPEAARTLVKSPPELWAELSDPTALARHLGAFGNIRITRLDREATVAWEGDRASGTVALEPTGWGTKVTVSADAAAPAPGDPAAPTADAPAETAAPTADAPAETAAPTADAPAEITSPTADAPAEITSPTADAPAETAAPTADAPEGAEPAPKRGFLARLAFWRRSEAAREDARPATRAGVELTEPASAQQPSAEPAPAVAAEPRAEPAPTAKPAPAPVDTGAVLQEMLANLGAAHHRPFSRD